MKKNIMEIANFAAPCKSSFVDFLNDLGAINDSNVIFVFPDECRYTTWIQEFQLAHRCFFVKRPTRKLKFFFDRELIDQLAKLIREFDIDIIHSHFSGYDEYGVLAAKKAKRNAVVVCHYHCHSLPYPGINPVRRLIKYGIEHIHFALLGKKMKVISVSDTCIEEIRQMGFRGAIDVVPNGINPERVDFTPRPPTGEAKFLFYGGHPEDKGLDTLLKAIKLIDDRDFTVTVVVGNGTMAVVDELNMTQNKHLSFIKPVSDVNALLQQHRIFLSASRRETFSYAIAEAILGGMFILTSDIPDVKWCFHLPTVTRFTCDDHVDLADKMKIFIDGEAPNAEALSASSRFIADNYSPRACIRKIDALFDSYLGQRDGQ